MKNQKQEIINQSSTKKKFPELLDLMFKNKSAIKTHKRKQQFKNKPK